MKQTFRHPLQKASLLMRHSWSSSQEENVVRSAKLNTSIESSRKHIFRFRTDL